MDWEHWRMDDIVCPYCEHKFQDSWEFNQDSGEIECYDCEKTFFYERVVDVHYSTSKLEKEFQDGGEDKDRKEDRKEDSEEARGS